MARKTVVGIGEILWDVFADGKHLGGATANFACHAQALGDRGCNVSRIGDDPLGREILERLGRLGLTTRYIQIDRRLPTGTVVVQVDRFGQPDFTIIPDVAWDNIRPNPPLLRLARRAHAVCYGSLAQRGPVSGRTIRQVLLAARSALHVCDLNLRGRFLDLDASDGYRMAVVARSIGMAEVLKLNDDELATVRRAFNRTEEGDALLLWLIREFGLWLVCVTRGAKGCVLRTARKRTESPGVRVKVVDTVGSGDAFTAALVHHLLRGRSFQEVADFANRVGAFVASRPGATPALEF